MNSKLTVPRLVVALAGVGLVVNLAFGDPVAAAFAVLGAASVVFVVRRHTHRSARLALASLVAGATAVSVLAALALPSYKSPPGPLVLNDLGPAPALPSGAAFDVLGFVAPDLDNSAAGVDRDAARLSTLAATGITLGSSPGSIDVTAAGDVRVRAHLHGAHGLAVVSNFDGTAFNGDRAARTLNLAEARRKLTSALAQEVVRSGWDGVVLDLEALPGSVRSTYPLLVRAVSEALGDRRVVVAIPAFDTPDHPALAAYDLAALGGVADQVVWMAYDEHALPDPPGPVAGLPWVRRGLTVAEGAIPRAKLLLGIPGYGYAWSGSGGPTTELTVPEAQELASQPGSQATWDDQEQEWRVLTADGRTMWFDDGRSFAVRSALAASEGLGGVALWRVGAEDASALDQLPGPALKHPVTRPDRPVKQVQAAGLVALTFDDGPDPRWTGRILEILREKQVPGTFFVIGAQAQRYPSLVREENRNGHIVANHTYTHHDLSKMPVLQAKAELLGTNATIEAITGRKPVLFRSPYGAEESGGRGVGVDQLAADVGLRAVGWNDDSEDWREHDAQAITRHVLDSATERTVVLLHDGGGDRSGTVAALGPMIDGLRARGFLFTTVDGLDASIASPYRERRGAAAQLRGLAIIAGYRLETAARRVTILLLLAVALVCILRVVGGGPLALAQARSARRKRRRDGDRVSGEAGCVSFSVVIPAHNEARVIGKSLAAIGWADWDDVEVIVVDDGSTDGTAEIAAAFPVRVIRQPRTGKAGALNAGIAAASGEIIVVVDADTVLSPGFLTAMAPHFADPAVGAVAGNVKVGNRRSLLARLQALEYLISLNLDRRAQAQLNIISVVPGAAGAFRRAALLRVGGYPTDTLVEDADLTVTLLSAGWRIPYEAAAVAWTEAPERISAVVRQRRRWAYGTVQLLAKHAAALLDPSAGRIGLFGLPWILLSQVVLPIVGPLADLYLLYLVITGNRGAAAVILGMALALDAIVAVAAVVAEREEPSLVLMAPLLRVLWRPLQLFAVFCSVHRWTHGGAERWRRVERYNTVEVAATSPEFGPGLIASTLAGSSTDG